MKECYINHNAFLKFLLFPRAELQRKAGRKKAQPIFAWLSKTVKDASKLILYHVLFVKAEVTMVFL